MVEVLVGFMSFFIKACIEALKLYPGVNARIEGKEIVYHNYYDVGVAIEIGDRIAVMYGGQVVETGRPDRPKSARRNPIFLGTGRRKGRPRRPVGRRKTTLFLTQVTDLPRLRFSKCCDSLSIVKTCFLDHFIILILEQFCELFFVRFFARP